jgi:hypothetical protein
VEISILEVLGISNPEAFQHSVEAARKKDWRTEIQGRLTIDLTGEE